MDKRDVISGIQQAWKCVTDFDVNKLLYFCCSERSVLLLFSTPEYVND